MREDYEDTYYSRTARHVPAHPSLKGETAAETLVIGGGLAGLATAVSLAERGQSVTLIEARRLGFGASGRNGGFLSPGFPLTYREITGWLGLDGAKALRREAVEAVGWARGLIEKHALDCRLRQSGHLGCSFFDDPDSLKRDAAYMNETFGANYRFIPREDLRQIAKSPLHYDGLLNPDGWQLHPLEWCQALGRLIEKRGGKVYEGTPALSLERKGSGWRVTTPEGAIIAARTVFCPGGYGPKLHPEISRALVSVSTHIGVTPPMPEKLAATLAPSFAYYDDRDSGAYYRPLPDGRLLWGGRVTLPWQTGASLTRTLASRITDVYPQLAPLEMEVGWFGQMSFGRSRMVQLGQLSDGLWFAFGFGGSGLGSTQVAGRLLAAAIAEGDDGFRQFEKFGMGWVGGPVGRWAARTVYTSYQIKDALKVAWQKKMRSKVA